MQARKTRYVRHLLRAADEQSFSFTNGARCDSMVHPFRQLPSLLPSPYIRNTNYLHKKLKYYIDSAVTLTL